MNIPFQIRYVCRGHVNLISNLTWSPAPESFLVTASMDDTVRLWDDAGVCVRKIKGEGKGFGAVATAQNQIIVGSCTDGSFHIYDSRNGILLVSQWGHHAPIRAFGLAADSGRFYSAGGDHKVGVWGLDSATRQRALIGPISPVNTVVASPERVFAGGEGGSLRAWDAESGNLLYTCQPSNKPIYALAMSPNHKALFSGGADHLIRVWHPLDGTLAHHLEGHSGAVMGLAVSADGLLLASRGSEGMLRIWRLDSWELLCETPIAALPDLRGGLAFHPTESRLAVVCGDGSEVQVLEWDSETLLHGPASAPTKQYSSAKLALIGDIGVGKTALGHRLAHGEFQATFSTHGQQFWRVNRLGEGGPEESEREVILWDFGGQQDYRLIHTLFLDGVHVALLVFDASQRDDPLAGVEYWLEQLRQLKTPPRTILIGAKADVGMPIYTEAELGEFCRHYGIEGGYIPTSAKDGLNIEPLLTRLKGLIVWEQQPVTEKTRAFREIQAFLLRMKHQNDLSALVLTASMLKARLEQARPDSDYPDHTIQAALGYLEKHRHVFLMPSAGIEPRWLMAPEILINLCASIVVAARSHDRGLGAIDEEALNTGKLPLPELLSLSPEMAATLREAAVMLLLMYHVCYRQVVEGRTLLIFPSLINQKRSYADVTLFDDATYRIVGAVENVYASLVAQMGYTDKIKRMHIWQSSAQFEFSRGQKQICGFRQTPTSNGIDLTLYFAKGATSATRKQFRGLLERFLRGQGIRPMVIPMVSCPHCEVRLPSADIAERLREKQPFIYCLNCGRYIDLSNVDNPAALTKEQQSNTLQQQTRTRQWTAYSIALTRVKRLVSEKGQAKPSVFISYAWGDQDDWVRELARYLKEADVTVIWDRKDNDHTGQSIPRFVERIHAADFALPVCTPTYLQKYLNQVNPAGSVVAAEMDLINHRMIGTDAQKATVLPILREGDEETALPPLLRGRVYNDFRDSRHFVEQLLLLILSIFRISSQDSTIADILKLIHGSTLTE